MTWNGAEISQKQTYATNAYFSFRSISNSRLGGSSVDYFLDSTGEAFGCVKHIQLPSLSVLLGKGAVRKNWSITINLIDNILYAQVVT